MTKVVYSERLGPITAIEEGLTATVGAKVTRSPLWTAEDIAAHASDADALIVGSVEPLDASGIQLLEECRVISRRGVGVNNIDLDAATEHGIVVAYVPAASVPEVSDHALALLLAVERRIVTFDSLVHAGRWSKSGTEITSAREGLRRLSDLTLGVVGYGRIGREVARKASEIFGEVLAFDAYPIDPEDPYVESVSFDELLERSHLVTIHLPLTDETHHMFDDRAFRLMQPGSTLVNTSRGGLVDSAALIHHIESGHLAGAGLDVTEEEPIPENDPILDVDNIVLTAHSAAFSERSKSETREASVAAVADALRGRPPTHVANPEVLDAPNCRLEQGAI